MGNRPLADIFFCPEKKLKKFTLYKSLIISHLNHLTFVKYFVVRYFII